MARFKASPWRVDVQAPSVRRSYQPHRSSHLLRLGGWRRTVIRSEATTASILASIAAVSSGLSIRTFFFPSEGAKDHRLAFLCPRRYSVRCCVFVMRCPSLATWRGSLGGRESAAEREGQQGGEVVAVVLPFDFADTAVRGSLFDASARTQGVVSVARKCRRLCRGSGCRSLAIPIPFRSRCGPSDGHLE